MIAFSIALFIAGVVMVSVGVTLKFTRRAGPDLHLRQRELDLRERELTLRERELAASTPPRQNT